MHVGLDLCSEIQETQTCLTSAPSPILDQNQVYHSCYL